MIVAMSSSLVSHAATLDEDRDLDSVLPAMDEEEFRAFYERTARSLWAYLSRVTGDSHEADDVLQEAYYRFYRAGARHKNESHRRNSLFLIATNLVRDRARRASRYRMVALAEEGSFKEARDFKEACDKIAMADRQTTAILRTDLARAMERMDPVQRKMLWLAYAQGASHLEIAELLGLRAGSIRTTLLRARRKLAGLLSGACRGTLLVFQQGRAGLHARRPAQGRRAGMSGGYQARYPVSR